MLNRPGQLPSELAEPEFSGLDRELPEAAGLQELAVGHNPGIRALRAQLAGAQAQVQARLRQAELDVRQ